MAHDLANRWMQHARIQKELGMTDHPIGTVAICASNDPKRPAASPLNEIPGATRSEVENAVQEWLRRSTNPKDILVLHWIGHGAMLPGGSQARDQILMLEDINSEGHGTDEDQDGFSFNSMRTYMAYHARADRQYFFIDACFSTNLARDGLPAELDRNRFTPLVRGLGLNRKDRPVQFVYRAAREGCLAYTDPSCGQTGFSYSVAQAGRRLGASPAFLTPKTAYVGDPEVLHAAISTRLTTWLLEVNSGIGLNPEQPHSSPNWYEQFGHHPEPINLVQVPEPSIPVLFIFRCATAPSIDICKGGVQIPIRLTQVEFARFAQTIFACYFTVPHENGGSPITISINSRSVTFPMRDKSFIQVLDDDGVAGWGAP